MEKFRDSIFGNPKLEKPERKDSSEKGEEELREWFEKLPHLDAVLIPGAELKWTPHDKEEQREFYPKKEVRPGIEAKMRLLAAAELFERGKVDKIILTGGVMENEDFGRSLSSVGREFLISRGIPEDVIVIDESSKNTSSDVEAGLEVAYKNGCRTLYLETTEFHLGRAGQTAGYAARKHRMNPEKLKGVKAEDLLEARSSHYRDLIAQYRFPDSFAKNKRVAIKKGLREALRRVIMVFDPDDRFFQYLSNKIRSKDE